MDVVNTIYKELFTVKLLHSGYESAGISRISGNIILKPDAGTKALFNGHQVDYRFINNTLVCFTRSKLLAPPAKEPKILYTIFKGSVRMRFLLLVNHDFLSRTYTVATGSKKLYLFSNMINNVQGADKFISKAIETHSGAKNYDPGTIIKKAAQLYTALQPVLAADGIAITNTAYWKKITPAVQAVNNADLTEVALAKPDENCFAVIEIYNTGTTNNTYDLFGINMQLLAPVYTIKFKSKI